MYNELKAEREKFKKARNPQEKKKGKNNVWVCGFRQGQCKHVKRKKAPQSTSEDNAFVVVNKEKPTGKEIAYATSSTQEYTCQGIRINQIKTSG